MEFLVFCFYSVRESLRLLQLGLLLLQESIKPGEFSRVVALDVFNLFMFFFFECIDLLVLGLFLKFKFSIFLFDNYLNL
jgi:hypothetical protein